MSAVDSCYFIKTTIGSSISNYLIGPLTTSATLISAVYNYLIDTNISSKITFHQHQYRGYIGLPTSTLTSTVYSYFINTSISSNVTSSSGPISVVETSSTLISTVDSYFINTSIQIANSSSVGSYFIKISISSHHGNVSYSFTPASAVITTSLIYKNQQFMGHYCLYWC